MTVVFDAKNAVPLTEAIHALRLQLMEALDRGEGSKIRFELAPVELTLQATATREGHAGIKWWILNADAKASGQACQTIKLTLDPKLITPAGFTSDKRVLLEGEDTRG